MSLDVTLYGEPEEAECVHCGSTYRRAPVLFDANITHNLNQMAGEAGIYEALWRPDENGIEKASQLIEPLERGLWLMRHDPDRFKKFNPENGWGDYDGFVPWVQKYLDACKKHPDAKVRVSR